MLLKKGSTESVNVIQKKIAKGNQIKNTFR